MFRLPLLPVPTSSVISVSARFFFSPHLLLSLLATVYTWSEWLMMQDNMTTGSNTPSKIVTSPCTCTYANFWRSCNTATHLLVCCMTLALSATSSLCVSSYTKAGPYYVGARPPKGPHAHAEKLVRNLRGRGELYFFSRFLPILLRAMTQRCQGIQNFPLGRGLLL